MLRVIRAIIELLVSSLINNNIIFIINSTNFSILWSTRIGIKNLVISAIVTIISYYLTDLGPIYKIVANRVYLYLI